MNLLWILCDTSPIFPSPIFLPSIIVTGAISSDEVWMTGTAAEIAPVTMIDGRKIGDGKIGEVSQKIHAKFTEIATGKAPEYDKWLDYVN